MTTYYVSSVDGNDGDAGTSWAAAKATLAGALAVATGSGDVIRVSHIHQESVSADTTWTVGNNVSIIVVDRSNSDALAVMDGTNGYIGHTSTSYNVYFAGAYKSYWRGLYITSGGTTSKTIGFGQTDGCDQRFELCKFKLTANASSSMGFGAAGTSLNAYVKLDSCTVVLTAAGQAVMVLANCLVEYVNVNTEGAFAGRLCALNARAAYATLEGCDLSSLTNTALFPNSTNGAFVAELVNCKLPAGTAVIAAQTTHPNMSSLDIYAYNCNSGDVHYALGHYNALGETTVSTSIYANDGAAYDGANRCSWKIVTTANSSYYTPYVSPWLDAYHAGTDAITPYLETLRSGSTTKYLDNEVWSEWSYQGTSGSTKATIVSDRMTPLGTAADQTASSLDASGWTGEDATNNAFMKLEAGSITPAEIGHIRARVCVGATEITVYVDPQIRATGVTSGINRVIPTGWLQQPAASGGLLTHPGMGGGARG